MYIVCTYNRHICIEWYIYRYKFSFLLVAHSRFSFVSLNLLTCGYPGYSLFSVLCTHRLVAVVDLWFGPFLGAASTSIVAKTIYVKDSVLCNARSGPRQTGICFTLFYHFYLQSAQCYQGLSFLYFLILFMLWLEDSQVSSSEDSNPLNNLKAFHAGIWETDTASVGLSPVKCSDTARQCWS